MSNTRELRSVRLAMRDLWSRSRFGDWIRNRSLPDRLYVAPPVDANSEFLKKPHKYSEAGRSLDSETDLWSQHVATNPVAGQLRGARRCSNSTSLPWREALRCGLYGTAGTAVALFAWYPGHWLMVLILLPVIWSTTRHRSFALSLWAGYYLTGARDIPQVCERFFSGFGELSTRTAFGLGIAFWLGQALLLAAPWALLTPMSIGAPRAARTALAVMFVSLPPLGIIGWISPLHVASALYPGWQLAGLLLGMCTLVAAACMRRSCAAIVAVLLMSAALVAHHIERRPEAPFGWMAVDTSLGRLDQRNYWALFARTEATMQAAQQQFEAGATVVVLPEELVGVLRPATQYWWQDYLRQLAEAKKTLILGVDLVDASAPPGVTTSSERFVRYTDSAVVVGLGRGRFDSRQPVPAGLWRPWASVSGRPGSLTQPYLDIASRRVAFAICYEDFLLWPHWRLLLDRPDLLVSMSNSWFNADLSLARIQQQSVQSVAQLAGVPLLRAVNR